MLTYVATQNAGKLAEMHAIFADSDFALRIAPDYRAVEEGEVSYLENARLKARSLAHDLRAGNQPGAVLADDSGIEVDALNGRPGVLSARYVSEFATWGQRIARMINELREVPEERRTARFISVMVVVLEDGREFHARGEVLGRIAESPYGGAGFGYDPIFIPNGDDRTFAELTFDEKNQRSHRRHAADALRRLLA